MVVSEKLSRLNNKAVYHRQIAETFEDLGDEIKKLSNSNSWRVPKTTLAKTLKKKVEGSLPQIYKTAGSASMTAKPEEVFQDFLNKIENYPRATLEASFLEALHAHADDLRKEHADQAKRFAFEKDNLVRENAARREEKEQNRTKKIIRSLLPISWKSGIISRLFKRP
jgi:hypothetical protein